MKPKRVNTKCILTLLRVFEKYHEQCHKVVETTYHLSAKEWRELCEKIPDNPDLLATPFFRMFRNKNEERTHAHMEACKRCRRIFESNLFNAMKNRRLKRRALMLQQKFA